jgi:hypothetical protein
MLNCDFQKNVTSQVQKTHSNIKILWNPTYNLLKPPVKPLSNPNYLPISNKKFLLFISRQTKTCRNIIIRSNWNKKLYLPTPIIYHKQFPSLVELLAMSNSIPINRTRMHPQGIENAIPVRIIAIDLAGCRSVTVDCLRGCEGGEEEEEEEGG